jgi:hypothetical protein
MVLTFGNAKKQKLNRPWVPGRALAPTVMFRYANNISSLFPMYLFSFDTCAYLSLAGNAWGGRPRLQRNVGAEEKKKHNGGME